MTYSQNFTSFPLLAFSVDNKRAVRDVLKFPRKPKIVAVNSELVFGLVMKILPTSQRGMHTESLIMSLEFLLGYGCKGAAQGKGMLSKSFSTKKFFAWTMFGSLWLCFFQCKSKRLG